MTRIKLKCFTLLSIIFFIMVTSFTPVKALDKNQVPNFTKIDEYVKSQMKLSGVPGLSISIVKKDKIIFSKGYGSINSSGKPITPETPFIIGSTSKSFTALAIMQLVESGKIELDAPVKKYIPWFEIADKNSSSAITIRNLLNHTSGISRYAAPMVISNSDLHNLENYIHKLSKIKLNKSVNTTWQYANENYQILGLVIQQVSGMSYEEYIKENIFKVLEMRHSYTSKTAAEKDGLAVGHQVWFGLPFEADLPYYNAYIPSGYIISSSEDMSNFLISQINNGQYKNKSILSSKGIEEMHKPAVFAFDNNFYGMGWIIGKTNGIPTIKHDGSIGNYCSDMYIVPDGDWGVIILSNIDNAIAHPVTDIGDGVISLIKGQEAPDKTHGFLYSYIPIDFIVLIILIIQMYFIIKVKRGGFKLKNFKFSFFKCFATPILINFFIPLLVVMMFPWQLLLNFIPDVSCIILFSCLVLIFLGIVKLGFTIFVLRKKINNNKYS